MVPLIEIAAGPLVVVIGIISVFFVMRHKRVQEKSMYSADRPFRKGWNRDAFASKRTNSPRYVRPMTNSFLPSLLGSGEDKVSGLDVSGIGFGAESRKLPLSGRAQI